MTGLYDTVTVHSYDWTSPSSRRDQRHPNVNPEDARLAAMLVVSCQIPARSTYRAEPWKLQDPLVLPTQGTKLYETTPPHVIKPSTLSRRPSREKAGPQLDLPFRHWEPTASALAPSLSTTSSPPDLAQTPCITNDERERPAEPLRSILRTRPIEGAQVAPTAVVSSSSTSAAPRSRQAKDGVAKSLIGELASGTGPSPLKRKKTIRVESPRTSDARQVESAQASTARGSTTPAAGLAARGSSSSAIRVAAIPASSSSRPARIGRQAGQRSSSHGGANPAIDAIQRCIPPPYAHPVLDPLLYPDQIWQTIPDRTQCVVIRRSFVDSEPLNPSEDRVKPTEAMRPYLQFPRRGAWLVPLAGRLPVEHTSPATWSRCPTDRRTVQGGPDLQPIVWTDARLSALWTFLTKLHEQKSFGYIRAQAIPSPAPSRSLQRRARATVDEPTMSKSVVAPTPDLIKINCDAHLALPIRALLAQINVPAARMFGTAGAATKAGDATVQDADKFLMGRALLWIDEEGRPIMTA